MLTHFPAVLLGLSLISSPALAQNAAPNHNVGDPNERICENLTIIGSRLAVKRVCATRAEWADRKRQDREVIEQAQRSPCVLTGYCHGRERQWSPDLLRECAKNGGSPEC